MDGKRNESIERWLAKLILSVEQLKRYEEYYAGHDAQLNANVYYRTTKNRVDACFTKIAELSDIHI